MTNEFFAVTVAEMETAYEHQDFKEVKNLAAMIHGAAEQAQKEMPMKYWSTKVVARNPNRNQGATALNVYAGPKVPGRTREEAERYCDENGLGFLHVEGEFIEEQAVTEEEIEWAKAWTFTPDN